MTIVPACLLALAATRVTAQTRVVSDEPILSATSSSPAPAQTAPAARAARWSLFRRPAPRPVETTSVPVRPSPSPGVVRTSMPPAQDPAKPTSLDSLPPLPNPTQGQATPPSGRQPYPQPPPAAVSPGSESMSRQLIPPPPPDEAESSARELQPGVGEIFIPPPPIPPVPPSMLSAESADAVARERPPLTLEALEKLACQHNPTLKQARAQVEIEFGTAIQAGLWPNPTLSYIQSGINPTPGGFQGAIVTQTIPTAGKKRIDRARWLEATKAAQWNAMAVEYRVLNDVRRMYFTALGMQAYVEVQKELVQNAEDEVVASREGYNMGIDNRQLMHTNNAGLQEQRLKYMRYQNMYRQIWQRLMAVVGVQMPFTPLAGSLEGNTTPIEWDAALQRLFALSPEVQATYAQLRYNQLTVKWQRVQPWPNIQITNAVGYNNTNSYVQDNFQVHLIGVPTWNWNQGYIRRANADVIRQQNEIYRMQLKLQDAMATTYEMYLTGIQHVESYQKVILPELRRNYELSLDSYEDDRQIWSQVLTAQRNYYIARQTYINHLVSWRTSEVSIVGFLLNGGLAAAPTGLPVGEAFTSAPTPAEASQFVSPGTFMIGP